MDPVEIEKWEAMEARLMKKLCELKDTIKLDMKQALGSPLPSPTPTTSAASNDKVLPPDSTCILSAQKVFDEMPSHQELTRIGVLRVIVSQVRYPLTEEVLHRVFDPFGVVDNVYVYERTDRVAALITFRSCKEAAQAQEAMHSRCIYNDCCWMDIQLLIVPTSSNTMTPSCYGNRTGSKDLAMASAMEIEPGEYSWEADNSLQKTKFTLKIDRKVSIMKGHKVVVCGPVGSGKSSLLYSVMGEIPRVSGAETTVVGSRAYVPQSAWIQTGTIQDNVLFGKSMDRSFYEEMLQGCALDRDLELWANGDMTVVGERGINLSGSQKQRIQLARALYSDSDVYLLDDPFSAMDAHTGAHLFKECIMRLMSSKTVIYVTHQLEFLQDVDLVLVMKDGRIVQPGKYDDLIADKDGELSKQMAAHNQSLSQVNLAKAHGLTKSKQHKKKQIKLTEIQSGTRLQICSNYWIAWAAERQEQVSKEKMIGIFVLLSAGSSAFILGRLLPVALGLLYLGKQESVEATAKVSKTFDEEIKKYCDVTLMTLAYAGTGNVLKVQKLLGICSQHLEKGEIHHGPAVLGIALIAMAEELGAEMVVRSLERLFQYGEQNIRRAVPLALGSLLMEDEVVLHLFMMQNLQKLLTGQANQAYPSYSLHVCRNLSQFLFQSANWLSLNECLLVEVLETALVSNGVVSTKAEALTNHEPQLKINNFECGSFRVFEVDTIDASAAIFILIYQGNLVAFWPKKVVRCDTTHLISRMFQAVQFQYCHVIGLIRPWDPGVQRYIWTYVVTLMLKNCCCKLLYHQLEDKLGFQRRVMSCTAMSRESNGLGPWVLGPTGQCRCGWLKDNYGIQLRHRMNE